LETEGNIHFEHEPGGFVLMNNLLRMRFTKIFATNFSFDLIYDDDVKKRLQIKEVLGIGLTVKI
jgi:hypothetical protein